MSLDDEFREMEGVLFDELGNDAVYDGVMPCRVDLNKHAQRFGEYGQVLGTQIEISVNKAEIPAVAIGKQFLVGAETFMVKEVLEEDQFEIKLLVV